MNNQINGLISTPMTPFNKQGELQLDLIDPFIRWQVESGVKGVYILGTWGGFGVMSLSERLAVAEAYTKACKKHGMQVIIHIGTYKYEEMLDLGRQAIELGADAISSTVPVYYSTGGYLKFDDYKRYFGKMVNDLQHPLLVYNNPRTTKILFEPREFVELVKLGVRGVKDGSKNVAWVLKAQNYLKEEGLEAEIIPGNSVGLLYGLLYGCKAVTSGASVVFPRETAEVFRLFEEGNIQEAAVQHRFVLKLREAIGMCSAPPAAAHFLLNRYGKSLGVARDLWPALEENLEKLILDRLRSLNQY